MFTIMRMVEAMGAILLAMLAILLIWLCLLKIYRIVQDIRYVDTVQIAYERAVSNGFDGTRVEWIESLKK